MPLVAAYHRPTSLADALALLAEPGRMALAGGTVVNADRDPSDVEVVDLQALDLDGIEIAAGRLRLGATTTLADLAGSDDAPSVIREAARTEAPSTLRTLSTVGGTVAAGDPDSVLLAALLVHDAHVELAGADDRSLTDLVDDGPPPGSIITAVTIDPGGEAASAATGRTPADTAIVSAVVRRTDAGVSVALTGVAAHPILVDAADPTAGLSPTGDFRGSSEYRLELAATLTSRAVSEVA